jgi:hypothetical protein
MKKPMLSILVVVLAIVVFTNIFGRQPDCAYSTYDGAFTFEERNDKSRDFKMCQVRFDSYKKQHPDDTVLYRICKKRGLRFWDYSDYVFRDQFKLPYMNWKEIDSRRGNVTNRSGFQDF